MQTTTFGTFLSVGVATIIVLGQAPIHSADAAVSGLPRVQALRADSRVYGDETAILFHRLIAEWKSSRGPVSSITAMALSPAYQRIIGMGAPAVPLILGQLESEGNQPDMWFWALKAITGVDPVRDEDRGDVVAMSNAWLAWGKSAGVS